MPESPITTEDSRLLNAILPELVESAKALQGQVIAYLQFEGIDGDSTDENFKKQIPVLGLWWNINQTGMIGPGTPGITGTGTSTHAPVYVLTRAGSHSPKVALAASMQNQQNISKAVLSFPRLGKTYAQATFDNGIAVNHFSLHNIGNLAQPDLYNCIGFVYGEYELKVSPQDDKGNVGSPVSVKFNVAQNKKA